MPSRLATAASVAAALLTLALIVAITIAGPWAAITGGGGW